MKLFLSSDSVVEALTSAMSDTRGTATRRVAVVVSLCLAGLAVWSVSKNFGFGIFAVWNMAPAAFFASLLLFPDSVPIARTSAAIAASAGASLVTCYFQYLWFYDVGQIFTGSSTSALACIFFPIYESLAAIALGVLAAVGAWIVSEWL